MAHTVTDASTGNATSAPASPLYPSHRTGWLHVLNRALARSEAAREIGIDATLLILAIAVDEDSQQYRIPSTFFFLELQRMLGIRSRTRLERARQKAIDSGWLIVLPGPLGDLAAVRYWTVIPDRLNLTDSTSQSASFATDEIAFRHGQAVCLDELQRERPILPQISEVQSPSLPQVADNPKCIPVPIAEPSHSIAAAGTPSPPETSLSRPILPDLTKPELRIPKQPQAAPESVSKFCNYYSIPMNSATRSQAMALYAGGRAPYGEFPSVFDQSSSRVAG